MFLKPLTITLTLHAVDCHDAHNAIIETVRTSYIEPPLYLKQYKVIYHKMLGPNSKPSSHYSEVIVQYVAAHVLQLYGNIGMRLT